MEQESIIIIIVISNSIIMEEDTTTRKLKLAVLANISINDLQVSEKLMKMITKKVQGTKIVSVNVLIGTLYEYQTFSFFFITLVTYLYRAVHGSLCEIGEHH